MKNTKARNLILDILEQASKPLTVEEIATSLSDSTINLSTIYRTLDTFEKSNICKKDLNNKGQKCYVLIDEHKHYHILECTKCHNQIKLDYCPFDNVYDDIYEKTNFKVDEEQTLIYGVCKDCQDDK